MKPRNLEARIRHFSKYSASSLYEILDQRKKQLADSTRIKKEKRLRKLRLPLVFLERPEEEEEQQFVKETKILMTNKHTDFIHAYKIPKIPIHYNNIASQIKDYITRQEMYWQHMITCNQDQKIFKKSPSSDEKYATQTSKSVKRRPKKKDKSIMIGQATNLKKVKIERRDFKLDFDTMQKVFNLNKLKIVEKTHQKMIRKKEENFIQHEEY